MRLVGSDLIERSKPSRSRYISCGRVRRTAAEIERPDSVGTHVGPFAFDKGGKNGKDETKKVDRK